MIEFLCTLAGMIAGGAIVTSIMSIKEQHVHEDLLSHMDNINTEKIRGITTQLHNLSEQVLDNVSTHTDKLKSFGEELTNPEGVDADKLLAAVDKIVSANQQMQNELENAQRQLAQQQEIIEQTTIQAKSDALTGLANRRAVDEYLFNIFEKNSTEGKVGLLLMDIDHFKRFNDTYGHLTGDAVLTCFARMITQSAGSNSFPARYGGEEFVVVLHGKSESELVEKAAYIRQFVSEQMISHEDLELTITASAGLCLVQPGDNLSIAYERSDEGLYKAKESGRNRGMWLSKESWLPFPTVNTVAASEVTMEQSVDSPNQPTSEIPIAESEQATNEISTSEVDDNTDATDATDDFAPAFLDLATFVEKVREHVQQLQQMELPAAAVMIEATLSGDEPDRKSSWQKVLSIAQTKIRGIDVLCNFRPYTICVFLPGCSAEASYERAADMKQLLVRSLDNWETAVAPDSFAVAVCHVLEKEDVANMLNRLEKALDEAHESSRDEIAIHDGASTQFLQL